MRIRKHAARILSSLLIPTESYAAPATPGATVAAGRELELHVCELNQSPWDAMAFTPPPVGPVLSYNYQVPLGVEDAEEETGFDAGATQSELEPAAAPSDVSGVSATRSTWRRQVKTEQMAEGAEDVDKREKKIEARKRNGYHNTKRIKRKATSSCATEAAEDENKVKMEVEAAIAAAAVAVSTCKKSDGKGWHCKRQAQRPHSLCEYHLTQVRSYYSNGNSTAPPLQHQKQQQQQQSLRRMHRAGILDAKQNAASIPAVYKKNVTAKKTAEKKDNGGGASRTRRNLESEFCYYYSGFRPWRGQRRSRYDGDSKASNADASNGDDDGDGACDADAAPTPMVHDQAPDDLDDDDDVDDLDGHDGDAIFPSKKRRRKPIKARSLKSLL